MGYTTFATDNALTRQVWQEKLYRDSVKTSYFMKFSGSDSSSLVQIQNALEKGQGDKVTFGLRMRLVGAGVTGDAVLEGNEEALSTYDHSATLEQYRHAVRDSGRMTRKRAMFSISGEAQAAIQEWGQEKIDSLCFDALGVGAGATADPTKIFYKTSSGVQATATAATAKSALTTADSKLTPAMISWLKAWAKTGGNRTYVPLRPVKVDGREYYVLLVHPDCMYDLKTNSSFEQAQREAEIRGSSNPLFTGATAIWDGVVIHEHENCAIAADAGAGSNVPWAKCAFMGAQSLLWAWGQRVEIVEEKFDFQNQQAFAFGMIAAASKPKFNNLDFGSVGVYLSRSNIAA